jgi:hypothetical protein
MYNELSMAIAADPQFLRVLWSFILQTGAEGFPQLFQQARNPTKVQDLWALSRWQRKQAERISCLRWSRGMNCEERRTNPD